MAVKTFSVGETLTASDTNTYLANAGLVYITSKTLSGNNTDFQGVFTSTYKDYFLIASGIGTSAATPIWYRMMNGATAIANNYYYAFRGYNSGGASEDVSQANYTWGYAGANTPGTGVTADIRIQFHSPKEAVTTRCHVDGVFLGSSVYAFRTGVCAHDVNTAYDGFQLILNSTVTFSSGVATVYGVRSA